MRKIPTVRATAALAGVLVLYTVAWAAPPGKCEFGKLKSAAKYSRCLLEASARTLKRDSAHSGSCDARLSGGWNRARERHWGGAPAGNDQGIRAVLQRCPAGVAPGLPGTRLPIGGGSRPGAPLGSPSLLAVSAECQFQKLRTAGWSSSCR